MNLQTLAGNWVVWLLAIAALLGLLLVVFLVVLGRAHRQPPPPEDEAAGAPPPERRKAGWYSSSRYLQAPRLRLSFLRAMRQLRQSSFGRDYRYEAPWFLLVGEAGSGKSRLLEARGLSASRLDAEYAHPGGSRELNWRFFNRGVVLEAAGELFLHPDDPARHNAGWRELLRLLERHRPRRPLDGVILTIPCQDLLVRPGSARAAQVARKMDRIYDNLSRAQTALGLSFPVYVLVTKCDELRGFRTLVGLLPEERTGEIFGWSSPYSLEAAFLGDWVNEAFATVAAALDRVQSEIFAQPPEPEAAERLFLLSAEFQRLQPMARACLEQIFRPTAYREGFYFRGLYFCGDAQGGDHLEAAPEFDEEVAAPAEPARESAGVVDTTREPVFLRDLIQGKILAEGGLAQPIARRLKFKNRSLLTAQNLSLTTALVLTLGCLADGYRIHRVETTQLAPMLDLIRGDMTGKVSAQGVRRRTRDLVTSMERLSQQRLWSPFYPLSWVGSLKSRIIAAMQAGFQRDILNSLHAGLQTRLRTLEAAAVPLAADPGGAGAGAASASPATLPTANAAAPAPLSIKQMPAYRQLTDYVRQLAQLQAALARYQELTQPGHGSASDLDAVMDYLDPHKGTVTSGRSETDTAFEQALMMSEGQPFAVGAADRAALTKNLDQFVNAAVQLWFTDNPVLSSAQGVSQGIAKLENDQGSGYTDLLAIQAAFTQLEAGIRNPDNSWIGGVAYQPPPPLRSLVRGPLTQLAESEPRLLQRSAPGDVRNAFAGGFQGLQQQLSGVRGDLTGPGPLLLLTPTQISFSPDAQDIRIALANLLNLPFMDDLSQGGDMETAIEPGTALIWHRQPLQSAARMVQAYQDFKDSGLIGLHADIQPIFQSLALEGLEAGVLTQLGEAQEFRARDNEQTGLTQAGDARAEIESFDRAEPDLARILSWLQRLGLWRQHARLQRLLRTQAAGLLEALDRRFESQAPYSPLNGGFQWWDGGSAPQYTAFGAATPEALAAYLDYQRQRALTFAGRAQPLLDFLDNGVDSAAVQRRVEKWRGIVRALEAYQHKQPGNAVASLQAFIQTGMGGISVRSGCAPTAAGAAMPRTRDYFSAVEVDLRRAEVAQCRSRQSAGAQRDYRALARLFNRTLAGRFPFASPAAPAPDAAPAAVLRFFRLYDTVASATRQALEQNGSGAGSERALEFLDQTAQVRTFLAAFLAQAGTTFRPVFNVQPKFRVHRGAEKAGDEIIGWTLAVGAQRLQEHGAVAAAAWRFDEPVAVQLRWAMNAPALPAPSSKQEHLTVAGDKASFRYRGGWSLLRLLAQHRAAAAAAGGRSDKAGVLLAFRVPLRPAATGAAAPAEARVFIRVQMSAPGKPGALSWPSFPHSAPALSGAAAMASWPAGRIDPEAHRSVAALISSEMTRPLRPISLSSRRAARAEFRGHFFPASTCDFPASGVDAVGGCARSS